MPGPTKCWRCQRLTEDHGGLIWVTIRVAGYLDEYDLTLCQECVHGLFEKKWSPVLGTRRSDVGDKDEQRAQMRDV